MRPMAIIATLAILCLFAIVPARAESASKAAATTTPPQYKNFDAVVRWQTAQEEGKLIIKGSIKNTRFPAMVGLEMQVDVVGAGGKKIATDRQLLIPDRLLQDDAAEFTLKAKLPIGVAPEKLRFTYRYRALENGSDKPFDMPFDMQTFEAPFNASGGGAP